MLYIFAGLPGTGKSTLARELAQKRRAFYLRIDTIEQSIRDAGSSVHGPEGYVVAYRVALDNLRLGYSVVADSVNPIQVTRDAWRAVAREAGTGFVDIEILCSDAAEHRSRVESRVADIPGHVDPTWEEVRMREYETWDVPPITIDTAGKSIAECVAELEAAVDRQA